MMKNMPTTADIEAAFTEKPDTNSGRAGGLDYCKSEYYKSMVGTVVKLARLFYGSGKLNPAMVMCYGINQGGFMNDGYAPIDTLQLSAIGKYRLRVFEFKSDFRNDVNEFKKGQIMVKIQGDIFPDLVNRKFHYQIREMFDPENYGATHDWLDKANGELKVAVSECDLWFVTLDFDFFSITDLDQQPGLKRHLKLTCRAAR